MASSNSGVQFDEFEDVLVEDDISTGERSQIIVYNDDYNTFDWVIQCFMEVCNHNHEQAEQLSILVHFKGKASVKTGTMSVLKPMKDALVERGLSAVIETLVED
ncbi:MAG TPA: ATP-dependent Clp protease adaptor ClpS [Saprospiraceae bacterium]|nr:ATP-dependent Clp protease adaptor ClpS [Saprospiraceae bacterium]